MRKHCCVFGCCTETKPIDLERAKIDIAMSALTTILSMKYKIDMTQSAEIIKKTKACDLYRYLYDRKIYPSMDVFATFLYDTYHAGE